MAQNPCTNTTRLRNRDYANRIRQGLCRNVLGEMCEQKVQERRDKLREEINRHRHDCRNLYEIQVLKLMSRELLHVVTPLCEKRNEEIDSILTEEQVLKLQQDQIVQEQEQWMLQEYDRILQEETEYLAMFVDRETNSMICPTCQKTVLAEESNYLTCTACGLMLAGRTSQEAKHLINKCVCEHAAKCTKTPTFISLISESNNMNLYMVCYDCSTLALIC
ncbi:uncharacterized protein LOC116848056 [Odontomachus brunneus]|uniref:uncharacterized protein LOC116848056 n=1 Tax=Odontomachus brunneus TaxID=486640 RepID=UPI0013F2A362|nr:uncharacterized protein LOC116848056 [Odontomachus brunneus]